ncbi:IniB N-terminal domain-containing protein [Pseudonocardia sp. NPDC049635]|uniref:IniB N-terminal domain-containing protein n=1 Tax=Pseudonocardia sp. NPDC049635 TaxID=3155506 RepID=UPI0033E4E8BD
MSAEKSLIQFILDLLRDPKLLAEFKEDPQGLLASCGLSEVSAEDVRDAIVLAQDNDDVSFDRNYSTGGNGGGGHSTPPPPVEHPKPGEDPITYLDKYVTNNHYTYNIDDRDTIVDNSINQNIDTGGGDFRQDIETNSVVASGDGAVAAGGDIEDSVITTGDDNIVGDGNDVVSGDDNTTAFGSGDATSVGDISADDGAAVAVGGDARGSNDTSDSFNETTTSTEVTTDISDSFNVDSSQDNDLSATDNSTTENHLLSHNDLSAELSLG